MPRVQILGLPELADGEQREVAIAAKGHWFGVAGVNGDGKCAYCAADLQQWLGRADECGGTQEGREV
ncbi:hypothetical protein [Streptomyces sp. A1136]|uniref:hypothetical protein n=1 Tax=Streptomyces sp. A1136 TaxID=2563102 RepID=UPI00109E8618|nr:hypothetical protein [Streptomyces sp. A1136]THA56112.1 hypothetical protein E6R62_12255 [Streptomyces sp. A1136]